MTSVTRHPTAGSGLAWLGEGGGRASAPDSRAVLNRRRYPAQMQEGSAESGGGSDARDVPFPSRGKKAALRAVCGGHGRGAVS